MMLVDSGDTVQVWIARNSSQQGSVDSLVTSGSAYKSAMAQAVITGTSSDTVQLMMYRSAGDASAAERGQITAQWVTG